MIVKPALLDQVPPRKIRLSTYSIRTEQTYMDWVKRYRLRVKGLDFEYR